MAKKKQIPLNQCCPFCGSGSSSRVRLPADPVFWVQCDACHAEGPKKTSVEDAVKAWNIDATAPWSKVGDVD